MVNYSHRKMKKEERRIAAVDAFHMAKKSVLELKDKLTKEERERKSVTSALDSTKRQAKSQRVLLHNAKDQLASSKEQIITLKKKLENVQKAKEQVEKARKETEQQGYDIGVTEIEEALKAEVLEVCRTYCLQVWNEALDQTGVEASSVLRKAKSVYYP